jgi:TPR repeat protein
VKKIILLLTLFLSANVFADVGRGLKASNKGDYETAFVEFEKLAKQGNAKAQNTLGLCIIMEKVF